jgi:hypothetical protein
MIIRPSIEDNKDDIKTYPDLESIVSEINHKPTGLDTMTTFPQEYKIIRYKDTTYSVYPLSDSERKNIESKLTGYETTRKRKQ